MSDKIITLNTQERPRIGRYQAEGKVGPDPKARLKWMADLVCAILDAEDLKRSSERLRN